MHRRLCLLLTIALLVSRLGGPLRAQAPAGSRGYAVSYVEVMPSAGDAMAAAFGQYRAASRKEDGFVRFERFEQADWPGHFALVETWRDQKALDAHGTAASAKQFQDALRPIRLSDYDERPYKTIAVSPARAGRNDAAVVAVAHVDTVPQADVVGLLTRLADASRKEPGCLRFDVLQHTMRPNHFTVIEVWESRKALDAHAAALHTKQYRDALQPISGGPLDQRLYKTVD